MCLIEKINKRLNIIIVGALISTFIFGVVFLGFSITARANGEENIESNEILLNKDKMVKDITFFEEGLNPYFSTSKMTVISNLSEKKIRALVNKGYVIKINSKKKNKDLPQKVNVKGKEIEVSIYSNNGDIIDVINSLIK